MSEQQPRQWSFLKRKPGSRYRQLFVNGRVAARTLYSYFLPGDEWPGMSIEEIAADCGLSVESVREAIEYCQSDPPELREDHAMEESRMEAAGMNEPDYRLHPSPRLLSNAEYQRIYRR